ncbi:MAG: hypothetical protein A2Z20_00280 [Bdellovibrionales bacterium RBG_16_40_8]|nr:MAG: hypothetical protein A2Z20_00280 [Bdellovibrionales bacterium RBG_16_40_8]
MQLESYGGATGIRAPDLLESAVMTPQASFGGQYVHNDVYEMAAAYAFHIAENQPFVDGNKRTALASALVFLDWQIRQVSASGNYAANGINTTWQTHFCQNTNKLRPISAPIFAICTISLKPLMPRRISTASLWINTFMNSLTDFIASLFANAQSVQPPIWHQSRAHD